MKILYAVWVVAIAIFFDGRVVAQSPKIGSDSILYKQVVDSLITIALRENQSHPIVIISEMRNSNEELESIVNSAAKYTEQFFGLEEEILLKNDSLKLILQNYKASRFAGDELKLLPTPAQIHFQRNGWRVFRSYKSIRRVRKRKPEFFCVASITQPTYFGSYAVVLVDRQFNPLGGGGYLQVFRRYTDGWKTQGKLTLWHY